MRVEPEIKANEVAAGAVSLSFHHVLDHGEQSNLAHRAVECAGAQGPLVFWQMHDRLFEMQNQFWMDGEAIIAQIVDEFGLNADAMQACLDDPATNDKITRMDQQRRDEGIRLRPSFNINGRVAEGSIPYALFQQMFDEALAQ